MNATSSFSAHWSIAPTDGVLSDLADINQSLNNIFRTEIGSDPTRPDFGSDWHQYIDTPTDELPIHVAREITLALKKWEPRVIVDSIAHVVKGVGEHVVCRVNYRLSPDVSGQLKEKLFSMELING